MLLIQLLLEIWYLLCQVYDLISFFLFFVSLLYIWTFLFIYSSPIFRWINFFLELLLFGGRKIFNGIITVRIICLDLVLVIVIEFLIWIFPVIVLIIWGLTLIRFTLLDDWFSSWFTPVLRILVNLEEFF